MDADTVLSRGERHWLRLASSCYLEARVVLAGASSWCRWRVVPVLERVLVVLFSAQCLARHWIHVVRQLLGAWTIAVCFFVKGNSDPEVDSCPALLNGLRLRRRDKCAQATLQFARARRTWKLDIFPTSLRIWQSFCARGAA